MPPWETRTGLAPRAGATFSRSRVGCDGLGFLDSPQLTFGAGQFYLLIYFFFLTIPNEHSLFI